MKHVSAFVLGLATLVAAGAAHADGWRPGPGYYPQREIIIEEPPRVIYEAPPTVIIERPPSYHHKHRRPQVVYVPGEVVVIRPTAERVRLSRDALPDRPYCREYRSEVRVGGRSEEGWGIACLQPDGAWKIQR